MAVYPQCITNQTTIRVTAAYPSYPDGAPHRGIDTVHTNYSIYAPEGGVVEWAQVWDGHTTTGNQSWGNAIRVRMADGRRWLAAHMASQPYSVGDTITKGQYVAQQGATGNVTGIHTHWEAWNTDGSLFDPSEIIRVPNAVGTWNVSWDAGGTPEPPLGGKMPLWLLFVLKRRGVLK